MRQRIIGWDVGGAYIKVAVHESDGSISKVLQKPCPLWKGISFLEQAVSLVLQDIPDDACQHAITMTGELVDLFASREQGVEQITQTMQKILAEFPLFFYAGLDGFLTAEQIQPSHYTSIASANWLASASLVASQLKNGLFVDMGSTTTDILPIADNKVQASGWTDYERLISSELVYTGIVRTAVMAVTQTVCFKGHYIGLMAEYFATMADIYRLTGELNEAHDLMETADNTEKTVAASARRLSRMIAYEYSKNDLSLWKQLAHNIKSQQKHTIKKACERQLSHNLISHNDYFIGAGIGRFLVQEIATDLGFPYLDFTDLIHSQAKDEAIKIADCAPAVAVAILFSQAVA